jgi:hypothetical protein
MGMASPGSLQPWMLPHIPGLLNMFPYSPDAMSLARNPVPSLMPGASTGYPSNAFMAGNAGPSAAAPHGQPQPGALSDLVPGNNGSSASGDSVPNASGYGALSASLVAPFGMGSFSGKLPGAY